MQVGSPASEGRAQNARLPPRGASGGRNSSCSSGLPLKIPSALTHQQEQQRQQQRNKRGYAETVMVSERVRRRRHPFHNKEGQCSLVACCPLFGACSPDLPPTYQQLLACRVPAACLPPGGRRGESGAAPAAAPPPEAPPPAGAAAPGGSQAAAQVREGAGAAGFVEGRGDRGSHRASDQAGVSGQGGGRREEGGGGSHDSAGSGGGGGAKRARLG